MYDIDIRRRKQYNEFIYKADNVSTPYLSTFERTFLFTLFNTSFVYIHYRIYINTYNYIRRKLAQDFSIEEITHILMPRPEVVECYVKETDGIVTDVCSFYHLPSSVIGNPKHSKLNAVYSYYNVATTISFLDLMRDALIMARNGGADVFNALNVQGNEPIFEPLKFGVGDGNLQYYVYNWKAPEIEPNDIGLVLL